MRTFSTFGKISAMQISILAIILLRRIIIKKGCNFRDLKIESENYRLNDQITIETLIKKSFGFELFFVLISHDNSTKSLLLSNMQISSNNFLMITI